jgi:hypothetical protein
MYHIVMQNRQLLETDISDKLLLSTGKNFHRHKKPIIKVKVHLREGFLSRLFVLIS